MSLSGLWEMFEKKSSYLYLGSTFLINLKDNQWVDNSLWLAFRMFFVLKHVLKKTHTQKMCLFLSCNHASMQKKCWIKKYCWVPWQRIQTVYCFDHSTLEFWLRHMLPLTWLGKKYMFTIILAKFLAFWHDWSSC